MNRILQLLLLSLIICSFNACIKTTYYPTELKVRVEDAQGLPFSYATVYLYETKSDYLNNTNIVLKTTTDANGYLYVTDLSPVAYYYYIESECYDNFNTSNRLPSALLPNTLNVYDPIVLTSVGQILVQNNANYPYEIDLDGTVVCSNLPAGQNVTIHEVPTGRHSISIYHLSNYDLFPYDGSITANVTCGATTNVPFP